MNKMPKKCHVIQEGKSVCRKPVFHAVKVRVLHPISGRKTWQTWKLCELHFLKILKENGDGWFSSYKKKPNAPVMECKIVE